MLSWFSRIKEGLDFLKNSITQGLSDFSTNVGTWFSNLGTNLSNWFSNLTTNIGNFFSTLGTNIGNWFTSLINNLKNLLSYINPFDDNFLGKKIIELLSNLLNALFVPNDDIFGELQDKINTKFNFINQISDIFNSLLDNFNYGDKVPTFNISYKGKTLSIIDFSPYLEYRSWLHAIILSVAWFIFIRKTFNKIPKIIGGV